MLLRLIPFLALGAVGLALYYSKYFRAQVDSDKLTERPFPFGVSELNGQFSIRVPLDDLTTYSRYTSFFKDHGFDGSGFCWEGHIIQILEKINPQLLNTIEFDAEECAFYAYADTRTDQIQFVNTLSPIFQDLSVLAKFVRVADKSRVMS